MAQNNNDDVARALAALAGGAVPSEHETPSGGIPSETTVFSPEPAAPLFKPDAVPAAPPAAPSLRAAAVSRPATVTGAPKPSRAAPPPLPRPSPPAAAKIPTMPAVPPPAKIRSSSATSKRPASPNRPTSPGASPSTAADSSPPDAAAEPIASHDFLSEITDDDDVIAPAPDISAFSPRAKPRAPAAPKLYEQVNFRRTLIPILLTGGIELIVLGAWSALDHNGILGGLGSGVAIMLIAVGVVLFALAVLNMLHVKQILATGQGAK